MIRFALLIAFCLGAIVAAPAWGQQTEDGAPAPEALEIEPVGAVHRVYLDKTFPVEMPEGAVDPEQAYNAFYQAFHEAVGMMLNDITEMRRGMEPGAMLPVMPLQPQLDRFAAMMVAQGRPPAWRYWAGFKLEPQNWLTINQDTITLRPVDSLPEALFTSFAMDEYHYPLNKEMMLKDTSRNIVGIFKVLGDEKWDTLRPEEQARLALCGLMYIQRGEWKDDPSPRDFGDWAFRLIYLDLAGVEGRGAADAALAYYDAWRIFGPDDLIRIRLQRALVLAGMEDDLYSRAVVAFVNRWLAFSDGEEAKAEELKPELEAIIREASADVMGSGEAYAIALMGLTRPLYVESRESAPLPPEIESVVLWMADLRWLRRINPELAEGEYGLSIGEGTARNTDWLELNKSLLKLVYDHDPLLVMNRDMGIEAWRNIEELIRLRDQAIRDKTREDDEDLPDLDEEA